MRRSSFNTSASSGVSASGIFRATVVSVGDDDLLKVKIPKLGLNNVYEGVSYAGPTPAAGDLVFVGFLEGKSGSFVAFTGVADSGNTGDPAGDITSVVAGTNLNGGGSSGTVTVNLDSDITLTSVTADAFYGDLYGAIHILVKNVSGGSLTKGTPVHATGAVGASGAVEVEASLAGTGSTMPAMGLLDQDLDHNGQGDVVVSGVLQNIDTDTPGYSVGDELYVAPSGGLTTTRPSGASELVQKIGKVIRVQQNTGEILVQGAGRTNDVPNGTLANDISGNAATATLATTATNLSGGSVAATTMTASGDVAIDTDTLFVDVSADRVGINTSSPSNHLTVASPSGNASAQIMAASGSYPQLFFGDGGTNQWHIESTPSGGALYFVETGVGYPLTILPGNQVGIGDTTPSYNLDVNGTGRFTSHLTLDGDLTGTSNTNFYVKNDSGEEILFQESSNSLFFKTNGTWRAYFTSGGDFIPYTGSSFDLGSSGNRWSQVWTDTLYLGGGDDGLRTVTGQYGSVQTTGTGAGNYEGYSINGHFVFMSNNTEACGIYNDVDNRWMFLSDNDSYVRVYDSRTGITIGGNPATTSGGGSGGNGYVGVNNECGGFSGTTAVMSTTTVAGTTLKRLGFSTSSYEFKSGIEDFNMSDEAFMSLRPITFHPDNQYVDQSGEVTEIVGGHTIVPDSEEAGQTEGLMPLRRAGFGLEDLYAREDTMILASEYSPDPNALIALLTKKLQETMTRVAALEAQ